MNYCPDCGLWHDSTDDCVSRCAEPCRLSTWSDRRRSRSTTSPPRRRPIRRTWCHRRRSRSRISRRSRVSRRRTSPPRPSALGERRERLAEVNRQLAAAADRYSAAIETANAAYAGECGPLGRERAELQAAVERSEAAAVELAAPAARWRSSASNSPRPRARFPRVTHELAVSEFRSVALVEATTRARAAPSPSSIPGARRPAVRRGENRPDGAAG